MIRRRFGGALAVTLCALVVACDSIVGLGAPPDVVATTAAVDGGRDSDPDAVAPPEAAIEAGPPGSLDPTFGGTGIVALEGAASLGGHGLAIEPSGAIVFCGTVVSDNQNVLLIGRVASDGSVDTTFSTTGRRTMIPTGYRDEVCSAVALVPGGGLAFTGFAAITANHMMFAAKLTETGASDTTFGDGSGFVAIVDDDVDSKANSILVQTDDGMILGGFQGASTALVRLSADGTTDPTFDSDATDAAPYGVDTFDVGAAGQVAGLVPEANGRILAAVQSNDFAVLGITSRGALDPTYGSDGQAVMKLPTPLTSGASDLVVEPDGSTVCIGSTATTIELVRFTSAGQVDPSFGQEGRTSVASSLTPTALALLPDGGFAVAVEETGSTVGVARFTAQGALDTTFGDGGFSTIPLVSIGALALAVDTTGRIVIGVGSTRGIILARFSP
jgi:uncharacterized delta-60 repeat protein